MPTYRIPHYFVIFHEQFPLGFAFLFPFLDDWLLLAPFSHQVLQLVCNVPTGRLSDLDARGCFMSLQRRGALRRYGTMGYQRV
jgi:hypothetical protein